MFEKILVALDGSPLSERVLGSLEPLYLRPSTEVVLAHVVPGAEASREGGKAAARQYLEAVEARLRAGGARVDGHVLEGDEIAHEIVSFAGKAGASLICVATHGRTGLRRLALGSVAEGIVRTADQPVLLVSPWVPPAPLELKRILVPLDGSERSEESFPVAAEIARRFGAHLILVHVDELVALDPTLGVADQHRRGTVAFERAKRALDGASLETVVRAGSPVPELIRAIDQLDPDLVLATTHGRTGLARIALGSVTEGLVRRSPVPVLVKRSVPRLAATSAVRRGE